MVGTSHKQRTELSESTGAILMITRMKGLSHFGVAVQYAPCEMDYGKWMGFHRGGYAKAKALKFRGMMLRIHADTPERNTDKIYIDDLIKAREMLDKEIKRLGEKNAQIES